MSFDKVVDVLRAQRNLSSLETKRIRVGGGGEQGMNEGWKRSRWKQVGKENPKDQRGKPSTVLLERKGRRAQEPP